jgi:hypothetical protein
MDEGTSLHPIAEGQQAQSAVDETPKTLVPADRPQNAAPGPSNEQDIFPDSAQQIMKELQELIELPGRMLPPETVQHLKNAGKETLLAVYSLWQNINRTARGESGEKVRKHIEVE